MRETVGLPTFLKASSDKDENHEGPLKITFRDFDSSPAVEARVREEAGKLERFHPGIISCRVTLERPHRHHHKGNLFHASIFLTVPGGDVEVNRDSGKEHEHEDIYVARRGASWTARPTSVTTTSNTKKRRHTEPWINCFRIMASSAARMAATSISTATRC